MDHAKSSLLPLLSLWAALTVAEEGAEALSAECAVDPGCADAAEASWYDSGHEYLTSTADSAAQWMDSFFGDQRADMESASSQVRVRFEYEWDEEDGNDFDVKLRGKLHLPAGTERLSLVFEGEDGGDETFESASFSTDEDRSVSLQYNVMDHLRQRIDLSVGVKSGPKGKLSARYRYEHPFSDKYLGRFSQEFFWVGGDGFGTLTRTDLDRAFKRQHLLRWSNRVLYAEDSEGVEWRSRLLFRQRLDEKSAMGYFTSINGETDPEVITRSYGLGVAYRRNVLRRWLFVEVEPSYHWRKGVDDDDRQGAARVLLRLEVAFDDRLRREKAARQEK